jgi:hypothetical protein
LGFFGGSPCFLFKAHLPHDIVILCSDHSNRISERNLSCDERGGGRQAIFHADGDYQRMTDRLEKTERTITMHVDDYLSITICANSADDIILAFNSVVPKLPKELRMRFNTIKLELLSNYDRQGLFDRCNNRTVSNILNDFSTSRSVVVTEGALEGKSYTLREPENHELGAD